MIFSSIGLPGRFTEWCDAILAELVQRALGPTDLVSGNTLAEIGAAALKGSGHHLIVASRQPTEEWRMALAAAKRPLLVTFDDPRACFHNLAVRHGLEWNTATRATAGSCATILSCASMPGALLLRAEQHRRDPLATATTIARWVGLGLGDSDIADIVGATPLAADDELDEWWTTLDEAKRSIAAGAFQGYATYLNGDALGPLIWKRDLFFIGDDPHQPADRIITIGGAIRNLLFGPYITLPPGGWAATVALAVSKAAADMEYRIEVIAGPSCAQLGHTTLHPQRRGPFEAMVEFRVEESTQQPISLRIANLRPASAGQLVLGHVVMRQRARWGGAAMDELVTALDP
jgi:hypothetical protein